MNKTLYVRAIDKKDNISEISSTTIKIDTTKPSCSISVSSSGLSMSTSDSLSGVSSYGLNKGSSSYNSSTSASLSAGTFYGVVKDKAGNTNSCSRTITAKVTKTSSKRVCPKGYTAYEGQYECYLDVGAATKTPVYSVSYRKCTLTINYVSLCSAYTSKSKCTSASCTWDTSTKSCSGRTCPSGTSYSSSSKKCYYNSYSSVYQYTSEYTGACSDTKWTCGAGYNGYYSHTCYFLRYDYDCPTGSYLWESDHRCYKYSNKVTETTSTTECASGTAIGSTNYCYS